MRRRRAIEAGLSLVGLSWIGGAHEPGEARAEEAEFTRVKLFWGPNHGHVLDVPFADVKARADRTYEVRGKSDHGHTFTVTAHDFEKLHAGHAVRVASSKTGGHLHRVRLTCAGDVDPPDTVSACVIEIGGTDGHELIVPRSHLTAGIARVYDIQGAATHTHAVTLEPAHFEKLAEGGTVHVNTSAGDQHTHLVAIRVAPAKSG